MRCALPITLGLCALVSARCGTVVHENIVALHGAYQTHEAATAGLPARREKNEEIINVYFYVITANDTLAGGHIPEKAIDKQMNVLNAKYLGTGFSFITVNTSYVAKPEWRNIKAQSDTEYNMKSSLRQGLYSDLNIYVDSIAEDPSGQPLGYATFPDKASKKAFDLDGVVVDPSTLPEVSEGPYSEGITLVHEVGHWLSLFHTFESNSDSQDPLAGCYGNGDFILDTPAEGSAAFGCDEGRDTCKGTVEGDNKSSAPGIDPIHNYMDYSNDACLNTFSEGQIQRMMTSFVDTRINYVEGDDGEVIDPEPGHPHN